MKNTMNITVDRDAVIDLLREGYAACDALEDLADVCPTDEARDLRTHLDELAFDVLGIPEDDEDGVMGGAVVELWERPARDRDPRRRDAELEHGSSLPRSGSVG